MTDTLWPRILTSWSTTDKNLLIPALGNDRPLEKGNLAPSSQPPLGGEPEDQERHAELLCKLQIRFCCSQTLRFESNNIFIHSTYNYKGMFLSCTG